MSRYGLNRFSRAVKRALDVVGAGLGVLVLAPLLTAIAIVIKLDAAGPVRNLRRISVSISADFRPRRW